MSELWGRLVADLRLQPDMRRIGRPRPRQAFVGQHRTCHLTIVFDTQAGTVRAVVSSSRDQVLSGEDELRIVARAGLAGWPGGATTGDVDFDARVAVLAKHPERILLRLDRATRGLLREMIEHGAWVTDDQVLLEPRATGAMASLAEAHQLIDSAVDLLRALRASTPEQLVDMAFGDPSEAQRQRAWRRVQGMSGEGRRWVQPLLMALERHLPPEGPALLSRIEPGEYDFDRWLALCDRYADAVGPALTAGWSTARRLGREGEITSRIAARLTDGRPHPPPEELAVDPALVRGLVAALADAPEALWPMLGWPLKEEALRVEILGVLAAHEPERAAERLASLDLRTPAGAIAQITALDRLPAAYEPMLLRLRPREQGTLRAFFVRLRARGSAAVDLALLEWIKREPGSVRAADPQVFDEAARRIAAALDRGADGPLLERCEAGLPPDLTHAITRRILSERPRHAAGWLARHAPSHRTGDPEKEAALLGVLAELGDPAGQDRCIEALGGSDFLRVAAANALERIGTARALEPLDALTGFFVGGEVKAAAKAAIAAIRERETRGPRGGLTVSARQPGGGLSLDE